MVDFKSTKVDLMSAVQGAAADDFTVGQLTGSEAVKLVSSDAGDTMDVDVYGIAGDEIVKDTVTLTGTDAVNTNRTDWTEVLAIKTASAMAGNLTISDQDDNAIATLTTPDGWVGAIATDDSDAADGHAVKITAGGATTGVVGVLGTDKDDAEKYELVDFSEETIKNTLTGFKTITYLLIGADEETTQTYSIEVSANTRIAGYTLDAISAGESGDVFLY